jgi:hypothetical protein
MYTLSAQRAGTRADAPGPSVDKFTTAFQCALPSDATNRQVLFGLWVAVSFYYTLKHLASFLLFKLQVSGLQRHAWHASYRCTQQGRFCKPVVVYSQLRSSLSCGPERRFQWLSMTATRNRRQHSTLCHHHM